MNTEALSKFIDDYMNRNNLSTYDVARIASEGGPDYHIANTTVWGARNNRWKQLYPSTMKALARGLGVTEKELWDIAQNRAAPQPGYLLEGRTINLPDSTWELIEAEAKRTKRTIDQYIEALVAAATGTENINIDDAKLLEFRLPKKKGKRA
jgi:hypothetical protein